MQGFVKNIVIALQFILGTALVMAIYGYFAQGSVSLNLIFNTCFFIGALIIMVALIVMFLPSRFLFDKLTDHSNLGERYREQRERKQEKANEFLFLGIWVILISGVLQVIIWLFTR